MVSLHYVTGYQSGKQEEHETIQWIVDSIRESQHIYTTMICTTRNGAVYEQDKFDAFSLYIMYEGKKAGGESQNNDCLYYCIRKFKNGIKYLPKKLQKPYLLKRLLEIEDDDPIPIELIEQVEDIVKLNINVSGDHPYASLKQYDDTMDIILSNGHYTLQRDDNKFKILFKGFSFKRRRINTYCIVDETIYIYSTAVTPAISNIQNSWKWRRKLEKNSFTSKRLQSIRYKKHTWITTKTHKHYLKRRTEWSTCTNAKVLLQHPAPCFMNYPITPNSLKWLVS